MHRELEACDSKPGHLQLLNILTRSAGYQNFQHFRAQHQAEARLEREPPVHDPVDHLRVERVARHFDAAGLLVRWPSKANHQALCLWALWSRLPSGRSMAESQISELLRANHLFGDHALLRRELFDNQLVSRSADGSDYRRIERRPPQEAIMLIQHLSLRQAS
ncbi:DUF2087 domain-containing protein [Rhodopseudomonas sp.]|uniref:DUF2087 domain-containing protein n=1 Tax=Rhodopseudomonas sp. TaxID=1078 RepID=UPI003456FC1E